MNTRRRQRTTDLLYSTWKVQTLLQPGKMMEIADEVLKQGIDLVALQEIRWQGHGEINRKNVTVIYSEDSLYQEKLNKAFWNGNQLMIDYAESELEGNSGS